MSGSQPGGRVRPSTALTNGTTHGLSSTSAHSSRSPADMGSISAVWNACRTGSGRASIPRPDRSAVRRSTAADAPASTWLRAPLTTASSTPGTSAASSLAARSSIGTATIAPGSQWSRISLPRPAVRRSPSSTESAPAACSAAYSPTLCPATTLGVIPAARHSRTSAHCRAKSAGCASSVGQSSSAPGSSSSARSGVRRLSPPVSPAYCRSQASRTSRTTGNRSYSSRATPRYRVPCPVKRNPVPASSVPPPPCRGSASQESRAPVSAATVSPRTARRCLRWARPSASVVTRSACRVPGWARRWSRRARALSASAASVWPATTRTPGGSGATAGAGAGSGASSRTTWTLVPPTPKELTPALRGPSPRGQGRAESGM